MGTFDGVLGGLIGAEMASVIGTLIEKHGGVQGIVAHLNQQGLGDAVRSWVGVGPNQRIAPSQVRQSFGTDTLESLAARAGLSPQDLATKLSWLLPQAIDKLTPGGIVPKA